MSRGDPDPDERESTGLPVMLLTAQQVADLCQVSLDMVYKWTHDPSFPVVMGERQVRIHARLLDAWLRKKAAEGRRQQEVEA